MSEVVRIGKLDPEKMMTPQKNATSICLRYVTIKSLCSWICQHYIKP